MTSCLPLARKCLFFFLIAALLVVPVAVGVAHPQTYVGGVELLWVGIWLETVWCAVWAASLFAFLVSRSVGLLATAFTKHPERWKEVGSRLELPLTMVLFSCFVLVSLFPLLRDHTLNSGSHLEWLNTAKAIVVTGCVSASINLVEKTVIQLIAVAFHQRAYAARIAINKFQIGLLVKVYTFCQKKTAKEDDEFVKRMSHLRTHAPALYAVRAQQAVARAFARVGNVAGQVLGDFASRKMENRDHPSQVVSSLLQTESGCQALSRRLHGTFVREGYDLITPKDLRSAFDNEEEAAVAFDMFDRDTNGDITMDELGALCLEIGQERKFLTNSLKDFNSITNKLDALLSSLVFVGMIVVFLSISSASAASFLMTVGGFFLGLSWAFAPTAQELLQSCVFVFVKHPFDIGDRVTIYRDIGPKGTDYFVNKMSLLYTEFKKLEGHVVTAPNSYLNTLFILNQRRSGPLAEAVPIVIRFGTTISQIDALRASLLNFVKSEKREFRDNVLTEIREVNEAYSLTLNIVFFFKSNWQNELIRLRRRNKFISALMMAMQEIGIEGPRRNQAGWSDGGPLYVTHQSITNQRGNDP
ncbi:uncharacterized protein PV06_00870 [Exophiala oligosperma]|uniref:EF-hand domain-containing protein n=2 Tax=Chaetothyriales TaxID=34395 RepID=A0A0D2E0D4_9EURO|nr:uncharacterized protein PV06_00870 [Exophiala oligosperma]KAJ9633373.1 hypothetical protein H2204_007090 [Knufia peltigerae]KIW48265.1 hypothetical protein PV06_00870 [Exophiala oligosperma]